LYSARLAIRRTASTSSLSLISEGYFLIMALCI
jgi:hypothetical protein